jgi:hypothetical protein
MGLDWRTICGNITADNEPVKSMAEKNAPSGSVAKLARLRQNYQTVQAQVQSLGYVLPGTVQKRHYRCGKPNCHCAKGLLHGPYYQWTRKVRGKTVNVNLDQASAAQVKGWIQNNRKLRQLCHQLERTSLAVLKASTKMCHS